MVEKEDSRQKARKAAQDLDKRLGVQERVIKLRIIRPFDETIEKEFREFKQSLMGLEKNKYKKKIKEFFDGKSANEGKLTYPDMASAFRIAFSSIRKLYNLSISKSFVQLMNNEKLDHYQNIKKSAEEIGLDIPSDLVVGLQKKIMSNFNVSEIRKGDRSLPTATSGFIPFYLGQGGKQEKQSLIKFYKWSDKDGKLVSGEIKDAVSGKDDFVLELTAPIFRDKKVEYKKLQFLCSSQKRRRNFKRNRDDATNKLIIDYLTGNIVNVVESKLANWLSKKKIKGDDMATLKRKYSQIAQYEILEGFTRVDTNSYFISFNVKWLPEKTPDEIITNKGIVAGIDMCYSKDKVLYLSIVDLNKRKENPQKIQDWQIRTVAIFDEVYGIRKAYDDWYSEKRSMQKKLSKRIESTQFEHKFNLRFENRRKYLIRLIVNHLARAVINSGASVVYIENLEGLRNKEDWFSINKIRSFPRAGLFNLLKLKLKEHKIDVEPVSPRDTSKTCSVCGKKNDEFDFIFRSEKKFPPFFCKDKECRFSKELSDKDKFDRWIRDADQNASRNIALRGAKLI